MWQFKVTNVRCVSQLILVTRKLMIEIFLMTLLIKYGGYAFNISHVIMKGLPIVTNFKRPIYQTFN